MIVYFLVIFTIFLWYYLVYNKLHVKSQYKDKMFIIGAFFILVIPCMFRSSTVGTDTMNYIRFYSLIGTNSLKSAVNGYYESLYGLLNYVLYKLSPYEKTIVIVNAWVINAGVTYCIYKYSKDKLLSLMIYVCMLGYTLQMNGARQYFAMVIVLFALKYIEERNIILYSIFIIIAGMIHSSTFLLLVLYFAYSVKFTRKKMAILSAIACTFYLNIDYMFRFLSYFTIFERYQDYSMDVYGSRGRTFIVAAMILLLCCVFYVQPQNRIVEKRTRILKVTFKLGDKKMVAPMKSGDMINVYYWSMLASVAFYLITMKVYITIRMAGMFALLNILLLPELICRIQNQKTKKTAYVLVYIFLFAHFILSCLYTPMERTIPFTFGD